MLHLVDLVVDTTLNWNESPVVKASILDHVDKLKLPRFALCKPTALMHTAFFALLASQLLDFVKETSGFEEGGRKM